MAIDEFIMRLLHNGRQMFRSCSVRNDSINVPPEYTIHYIIRTDHKALRLIQSMPNSKGKLAMWRLRLSVFDYEIVHKAGIKNHASDALSSLDSSGGDTLALDDFVQLMFVERDFGKPDNFCYLRNLLKTVVYMPDILYIDIADPPPSLPE